MKRVLASLIISVVCFLGGLVVDKGLFLLAFAFFLLTFMEFIDESRVR